MFVKNHRLFYDDNTPVPFHLSPNRWTTRPDLRFLTMHYTASGGLEGTVSYFLNNRARVSAHILIDRDGRIVQMVPFNQTAWHAGESQWNDFEGLNNYSVGIELVNAGKLTYSQYSGWRSWFQRIIPDEEVVVAKHKNETVESGWHAFTSKQIETAVEVATIIIDKYQITEVLGHDDISPYRKSDPGPAFPMNSFRSKVLGRYIDKAKVYKTTTWLNIRTGPGSQFERIEESPLPPETKVVIQDDQHHSWRFVDVLDPVREVSGIQGWVHGAYLKQENTD